MTRCSPSRPCPQRSGCARAAAGRGRPVDASISHGAGIPCPMFIDRRGLALLQRRILSSPNAKGEPYGTA